MWIIITAGVEFFSASADSESRGGDKHAQLACGGAVTPSASCFVWGDKERVLTLIFLVSCQDVLHHWVAGCTAETQTTGICMSSEFYVIQ